MSCFKIVLFISSLVLCSACRQPIYDWGQYDKSIARLYADGDLNYHEEIDILSREVVQTQAAGKRVPPGKYMYLGYLYSAVGNIVMTLKYFELEKKHFPESEKFVDGVLKRIQRKKETQ